MISIESERYHTSQYQQPYESTHALADFVKQQAGTITGDVLDVGCGAGAVLYWLDIWGVTSGARAIGIDSDPYLIGLAQKYQPFREFRCRDFTDPLPSADVVLSVQTLSFIEDSRRALAQLLAATRQWLFLTSLFWDGVSTHTHASDVDKIDAHYNVIEREAFHRVIQEAGATIAEWRRFEPRNMLHASAGRLRSRTEGAWTMSGPLLMPWWMVAIKR